MPLTVGQLPTHERRPHRVLVAGRSGEEQNRAVRRKFQRQLAKFRRAVEIQEKREFALAALPRPVAHALVGPREVVGEETIRRLGLVQHEVDFELLALRLDEPGLVSTGVELVREPRTREISLRKKIVWPKRDDPAAKRLGLARKRARRVGRAVPSAGAAR